MLKRSSCVTAIFLLFGCVCYSANACWQLRWGACKAFTDECGECDDPHKCESHRRVVEVYNQWVCKVDTVGSSQCYININIVDGVCYTYRKCSDDAPSCGFGEVECMYDDDSFLFVSYDYREVLTGDGCIVTF
jgi:hypothetical protein